MALSVPVDGIRCKGSEAHCGNCAATRSRTRSSPTSTSSACIWPLNMGASQQARCALSRHLLQTHTPAMECSTWQAEAALRCLRNNLHPDVAERPEDLVVYGGRGKAARDH